MVMNRIQAAIKAFSQPQTQSKSLSFTSSLNGWVGAYTYGRNSNLIADKWGAAMAAAYNPYASAIVKAVSEAVSSIPYSVRTQDGKTVADMDDPGSDPLMLALEAYSQKNNGMSIFEPWFVHRLITGEVYVRLGKNAFGVSKSLELIHPLVINPESNDGYTIHGFRVFMMASDKAWYTPDEIVFDRAGLNLLNNINGWSPMMTLIASDTMNVIRSAGQAMLSHFDNNGLPHAIVSPDATQVNPDPEWTEEQMRRVRKVLSENKGAGNQYSINVFPKPLRVDVFEQPDLKKWAELIADLKGEIFSAYGIAPSAVGLTYDTKYQVSEQDMPRFKQTIAKRLQAIERIVNTKIVPFLYGGENPVVFEFDLSSLQTVDTQQAELTRNTYTVGGATINELRQKSGLPDIEGGDKLLMPSGYVLVPLEQLAQPTPPTPPPLPPSPETVTAPRPTLSPPTPAPRLEAPRRAVDTKSDDGTQADNGDALAELEAWLKFHLNKARKKHDREFTFENIKAVDAEYITSAIAHDNSYESLHTAFYGAYTRITGAIHTGVDIYANERVKAYVEHLEDVTGEADENAVKAFYVGIVSEKAIQATRLEFEDKVEDILNAAVNGKLDRRRFTIGLKSAISVACRKAYLDGLEDAGIPDAELTLEDETWLDSWISEQSQYVKGLGDRIYKDDLVTPDELPNKPAMWWNMSCQKAYYEGLASGTKNGLFEWVLGNAEHCDSCIALSGQIRRFSYWKDTVLPKSTELACGGFNCKCNLAPTRKRQTRGRLPNWRKAHEHVH